MMYHIQNFVFFVSYIVRLSQTFTILTSVFQFHHWVTIKLQYLNPVQFPFRAELKSTCCNCSLSSHLLARGHTLWLRPARAPTAAAATPEDGNSSAKQTSTFEACSLQPLTMTWSNSVIRESHTSSYSYQPLIFSSF